VNQYQGACLDYSTGARCFWTFDLHTKFHFAMGVIHHGHISFRNVLDLPRPYSNLQWARFTKAIFYFAMGVILMPSLAMPGADSEERKPPGAAPAHGGTE
jgi:hypothetical protein